MLEQGVEITSNCWKNVINHTKGAVAPFCVAGRCGGQRPEPPSLLACEIFHEDL